MKKISIYSFLIATVLLTGCSQKSTEMDVNNASDVANQGNSSESVLNNIPDTNIDESMSGSFDLAGSQEDGVYYIINGKKVFIENIYFGFDKYNLNPEMKEKAISNASKLSALNESTTVKVSGNTDEWGTDEYNYALGLKRAKAVKEVLIANGVNSNVTLISYGESNPVCSEKNKNCWQKNRRVNHTLTK